MINFADTIKRQRAEATSKGDKKFVPNFIQTKGDKTMTTNFTNITKRQQAIETTNKRITRTIAQFNKSTALPSRKLTENERYRQVALLNEQIDRLTEEKWQAIKEFTILSLSVGTLLGALTTFWICQL